SPWCRAQAKSATGGRWTRSRQRPQEQNEPNEPSLWWDAQTKIGRTNPPRRKLGKIGWQFHLEHVPGSGEQQREQAGKVTVGQEWGSARDEAPPGESRPMHRSRLGRDGGFVIGSSAFLDNSESVPQAPIGWLSGLGKRP